MGPWNPPQWDSKGCSGPHWKVVRVGGLPCRFGKYSCLIDPKEIKDRLRCIERKGLDLLKLSEVLNHALRCTSCLSEFPFENSLCDDLSAADMNSGESSPQKRAFLGPCAFPAERFWSVTCFGLRDSAGKGMTREIKWPQKREGWKWGEGRGWSENECHTGTKRKKGTEWGSRVQLEMERCILESRETSEKTRS